MKLSPRSLRFTSCCAGTRRRRRECCPDGGSRDPGMGAGEGGLQDARLPPLLFFLSFSPAGYPFLVRRRDRSQSEEEEEEEAAGAAPPPFSQPLPPSPEDTDGYERLIYGKDKALLGTGDAVPQAFQERPRLLSTI